MKTTNVEKFSHYQPFGGSDPAFTATAPSAITTETPSLTPLMLSGKSMVKWDGVNAGKAIGVLALPLTGKEMELNYYKSGSFRLEDIQWPAAAVDENLKRTAFAGTSISVI